MFLSLNATWSVPDRWNDLADDLDVGARLARGEHLRHPADAELGVAAGDDRRRDDVDAAGQDRHVEPLVLEVALVHGREVAGELGLREPLELELDLVSAALRAAAARTGRRRRRRGGHEDRQLAREPDRTSSSWAPLEPPPRPRSELATGRAAHLRWAEPLLRPGGSDPRCVGSV